MPKAVTTPTLSGVVVSCGHLLVGAAITAAAEAGLQIAASPPIWTDLLLATSCLLTAVYVSPVRFAVGADRITIGLGACAGKSRLLATSDVAAVQATNLSAAQVFGLGVSWHRRSTRLTVRPPISGDDQRGRWPPRRNDHPSICRPESA